MWTIHYTETGEAYEFNMVTMESRWGCSQSHADQQQQAFMQQQAVFQAAHVQATVDVGRVQEFALQAEAAALEAQASQQAAAPPRASQAALDAIVIQRAQAHLSRQRATKELS